MDHRRSISRMLVCALAAFGGLAVVSGQTAAAAEEPPLPAKATVEEAFTLTVDDGLRPATPTVAPFGRKGEAPVAALSGPHGRPAEYVSGELLVSGEAGARWAADAFGGEVATVVRPGEAGIEVPDIYVVTFDPHAVDTRGVVDDLTALHPEVAHGPHRVSDEAGLGTLAAAAALSGKGITVDLDWLTTSDTIRTRATTEAPTGLSAFGTNAFAWSPLTSIGVPEAWNVLARAGRLVAGRIPLAVVDSGYSPADADRPAGGFSDPPGPSSIPCSTGPCPFHGSDVASTAMAIPDNRFGAAGPAGPVASPILIDRQGFPLIADMSAQVRAVAAGARIVNMSFGAELPAVAGAFTGAYDSFTASVKARGVIQVATAGNSGIDIDGIDCFITCWEGTLVIPCENTGVLCVGGLSSSGTTVTSTPHPGSNLGSGGLDPTATVDIWASFVSIVGPNTGSPANASRLFPGTSAAAPLVSGSLALAWAASPSAPGAAVEATVLGTARSGSCSVTGACARRIVDALAAVNALLPNRPPDLAISAPSAASVPRGTPVTFTASASDPDGPSPVVRWFVDGTLRGTGPSFTYVSTSDAFGQHRVTATATDVFGFVVPDADGGRTVTLTNTPPSVQITSPGPNATLVQWPSNRCRFLPDGTLACPNFVGVTATTNDPNNSPATLPDANVTWYLDGSLAPFGTGHSALLDVTGLPLGAHTLTVRASDGQFTAEAHVYVTIVSNRFLVLP